MPYSSSAAFFWKPFFTSFFLPSLLRLRPRLLLRLARPLPLPPPLASFFLSSASSRSSFSELRSFFAAAESSPGCLGCSIISSSRSGRSCIARPGNFASFSLVGAFLPLRAGGPPFTSCLPPPAPPIFPISENSRSQKGLAASAPFSLSFFSKSLTSEASSPIVITNSARVLSSIPQWFWISSVTLEMRLSLRSASMATSR
mmetsp:Transcript_70916/g.208104  ORF Transcript_70916/g.208104 Transcript_70916/m.208104 type:complete len:201 (-) Transcript_70916:153-755(-)